MLPQTRTKRSGYDEIWVRYDEATGTDGYTDRSLTVRDDKDATLQPDNVEAKYMQIRRFGGPLRGHLTAS